MKVQFKYKAGRNKLLLAYATKAGRNKLLLAYATKAGRNKLLLAYATKAGRNKLLLAYATKEDRNYEDFCNRHQRNNRRVFIGSNYGFKFYNNGINIWSRFCFNIITMCITGCTYYCNRRENDSKFRPIAIVTGLSITFILMEFYPL